MTPIFIVNLIVLALLTVIAIIDLKHKTVPSFLTTMTLLITFIFYFDNLNNGIIAFLFARILYEMDWIGGMADIKGCVILGLLSPNLYFALTLPLVVVLVGNVYIFAMRKILKEEDPIALFPIFPLIHLFTWLLYANI